MENQLILAADLFGTIIFAITGAIKGISHKLDLLGVTVLGCTVGIGGGILRDAVLGATPAAALSNEIYLIVCILAALIIFLIPRHWLKWHQEIIVYLDAVGLGVFTALGNAKALQFGVPPITIILAGVITAAGGGVFRDVLVCTTPQVLKSDFYATASLIGGMIYCVLCWLKLPLFNIFVIVSLTVTMIRIVAYHFKLQLPK